jgi:hypothetical protein
MEAYFFDIVHFTCETFCQPFSCFYLQCGTQHLPCVKVSKISASVSIMSCKESIFCLKFTLIPKKLDADSAIELVFSKRPNSECASFSVTRLRALLSRCDMISNGEGGWLPLFRYKRHRIRFFLSCSSSNFVRLRCTCMRSLFFRRILPP